MTNRYFAAIALAGLVSFAACADEVEVDEGDMIVADTMAPPVTPAPVVVTDSAAMVTTDTMAPADTTP